jgi:hypothetical protein
MIASVASPTSVKFEPSALPAPLQKIGELEIRFRRDEPLFIGQQTGPSEGFASLDDAMAGAAGLVREQGGTFAVTHQGDRFQANELLQPVWAKGRFREDMFATSRAQIEVLDTSPTKPKFGFYKNTSDRYGTTQTPRTGSVNIDAASGVKAIVGADWALVDGTLQSVTAVRPKPPVDPKPPIDPKPPVDPPNPGSGSMVQDVTEGLRLAKESARIIGTVPVDDKGDESTKASRIKAYKTNMAAQERLEQQFGTNDASALSTLRSADASLEDANWQLAKKPSPDGRFNGVDVPGALADTQHAVDLLEGLLGDLTASK